MIYTDYLETKIGWLEIAANDVALRYVKFIETPERPKNSNNIVAKARTELQEYFQGQRKTFDVPLAPEGTAFQQQVWRHLLDVPCGKTASYLDIAHAIGNSKAVRAVGAANGKNPIAIIIPCHRVIGKNGTLTGYAGGLSRKRWLLNLESA